jgi:acyl-CoA thioester hydrolase
MVEFYDCDAMGVAWHGNYVKFFEVARRALLEKIGYSYDDMKGTGWVFPVTSLHIKYKKILTLGKRVRARAILDEYENCLKIKFELYNAETGELCTKGDTTQMAVHFPSMESSFVCPPELIAKVKALIAKEGQP